MIEKDPLSFASDVLDAQPLSRLLGARLTQFGDGRACIELDIDERHRQQYGLVHGGTLAYLADNAIAFAAGSTLGSSVVSTGMTINLVGNTREGTLRAVAQVLHATSRDAICTVEVSAAGADGSIRVCALGQGTVQSTVRDGPGMP